MDCPRNHEKRAWKDLKQSVKWIMQIRLFITHKPKKNTAAVWTWYPERRRGGEGQHSKSRESIDASMRDALNHMAPKEALINIWNNKHYEFYQQIVDNLNLNGVVEDQSNYSDVSDSVSSIERNTPLKKRREKVREPLEESKTPTKDK